MPLFIAISGYLSYGAIQRHSWRNILTKRFWQLCIPYLAWCTINFAYSLMHGATSLSLRSITSAYTSPYWFISTLFILTCLLLLLKHLFRDNALTALAFIPLSLCLPDSIPALGYDISKVMFLYPFFIGAYYLAQHQETILATIEKHRISITLGLFTLFALLIPLYHEDTYIYISKYSLWGEYDKLGQLCTDAYRLIIGALGAAFFALIAHRLPTSDSLGTRVLVWFGQNSLGLYFIQEILFAHYFRHLDMGWAESYWGWSLVSAIIITIASLIILTLKSSKYTRALLLGN